MISPSIISFDDGGQATTYDKFQEEEEKRKGRVERLATDRQDINAYISYGCEEDVAQGITSLCFYVMYNRS